MTPLTAFLSRMLPSAIGCPEPFALQALLDSATEFCDLTRAIRVTSTPVAMLPGVAEYDIDIPTGTEPLMFVRAWVGQTPLALPPEADRGLVDLSGPRDEEVTGTPSALIPFEGETVRVYPTPDTAAAGQLLTVRLALRPKYNATQVPDELFYRWRDAVIGGALYRVCAVEAQPHSSPNTAATGRAAFVSGVSQARVEANRGSSPAPLRVRGAPFV